MIIIVWKINLIPKLNRYTKIEVRNFKDFNADNFRTDLRGCGKLGKLFLGCSRPWAYRLLGKQSQLGNIRCTVGQYWLIIKKNGTNSVNFVGNFVISGKLVGYFEKFWYVRKIFGPLKWYTDRNFFGDGGGGEEVVKINFLRKKILALVGQNPKKSGKFVSALLIFSFRYAHVLDKHAPVREKMVKNKPNVP